MRPLVALIVLALIAAACSTLRDYVPQYRGVDVRTQVIVNEYIYLAAQRGIKFDKEVTVGFSHLEGQGNIVGLTHFGPYFREIELDIDYWNRATNTSRMTLVFHELGHAYCDRDHDYGQGLNYPEVAKFGIKALSDIIILNGPGSGFMADGCPLSIMYPTVLEDSCLRLHYTEYIKELFDRCDAY